MEGYVCVSVCMHTLAGSHRDYLLLAHVCPAVSLSLTPAAQSLASLVLSPLSVSLQTCVCVFLVDPALMTLTNTNFIRILRAIWCNLF